MGVGKRQPLLVSIEERLCCFAGVIPGPVLDEDEMLRRLVEDLAQKVLVTLGVEALSEALIEEVPGEKINQAEHFVSPALAGGFDDGLLTHRRPGVAQGAPLRKADLIAEQNHHRSI